MDVVVEVVVVVVDGEVVLVCELHLTQNAVRKSNSVVDVRAELKRRLFCKEAKQPGGRSLLDNAEPVVVSWKPTTAAAC